MKIKEGKYNGKPILEFWDEDAAPGTKYADMPAFSFGVKKARIIIDHFAAVKEFWETYKEV